MITLKARWTWLKEWQTSYSDANFVLINKNAFFIVKNDGTYGRVIGSWAIVNRLERELISRKVRFARTDVSLKLLSSSKRREYLAHYTLGERPS